MTDQRGDGTRCPHGAPRDACASLTGAVHHEWLPDHHAADPTSVADSVAGLPDDLAAAMERRRLSFRDVGRESGVPHVTVWQTVSRAREPRLSTVVALLRWLDGVR